MSGSNFSIFRMNCSAKWKWKARFVRRTRVCGFASTFFRFSWKAATIPRDEIESQFRSGLFLRDQAVRWDKNKTRSMMCEISRCEVNSTRMINAREGETKKSRSESPLKIIELKVVQVRMCCKWRGRRHQGWECSERKICHRASGISFAWIARRFPMNFPSA